MFSSAGPARRDRRLLSEINVTPLVDVTLVLLIIFMVTTPMLQRGTDVELPRSRTGITKGEDRLTLTLARDRRVYLNDQEVPPQALAARLRAAAAARQDRVLYFRGDAAVPYGMVIEVMDAVKAAGFESVGMITERAAGAP